MGKSERALASALRIKIIDQIAEVDLPLFLLEKMDTTLNELNYYKLSNLFDNIKQYTDYLYSVARKYNNEIRATNKHGTKTINKNKEYEQYYTHTLIKQGFVCCMTKRECISLYTKYSVSSILTMKEYINRRILQSTRSKQKSMSQTSISPR